MGMLRQDGSARAAARERARALAAGLLLALPLLLLLQAPTQTATVPHTLALAEDAAAPPGGAAADVRERLPADGPPGNSAGAGPTPPLRPPARTLWPDLFPRARTGAPGRDEGQPGGSVPSPVGRSEAPAVGPGADGVARLGLKATARPLPPRLQENCGKLQTGPAYEQRAREAVEACLWGLPYEPADTLAKLVEDEPRRLRDLEGPSGRDERFPHRPDNVCLPAFFIIGAGKSGTSTLATVLQDMPTGPNGPVPVIGARPEDGSSGAVRGLGPQVRFSPYRHGHPREVSQIFVGQLGAKAPDLKILMRPDSYKDAVRQEWAALFDELLDDRGYTYEDWTHWKGRKTGRKKFEKTAFYYDSLLAACNARVLVPQARMVFATRDPVARAVSQYRMFLSLLASRVLAFRMAAGHPPLVSPSVADKYAIRDALVRRADAWAELDRIAAAQKAECAKLKRLNLGGRWTVDDFLATSPRAPESEDFSKVMSGLVSIEPLLRLHNAPDDLPNGDIRRIIQSSLYYTHMKRWVSTGHDRNNFCFTVLEDLNADPVGAIKSLLTCLGVEQMPTDEWLASSSGGNFAQRHINGAADRNTADGFFLYGFAQKIRANAADFTLEEAYGKVKPQVDEAVACFRAALQEKATALFYDDMKSLEGFMRRDLDLEELWDIAAPAA